MDLDSPTPAGGTDTGTQKLTGLLDAAVVERLGREATEAPGPALQEIIETVQAGADTSDGAAGTLFRLGLAAAATQAAGIPAMAKGVSEKMKNAENIGKLEVLRSTLEIAAKIPGDNGALAKRIIEKRMQALNINPPPLPHEIMDLQLHQKWVRHGQEFEADYLFDLFLSPGSKRRKDDFPPETPSQTELDLEPIFQHLRQYLIKPDDEQV